MIPREMQDQYVDKLVALIQEGKVAVYRTMDGDLDVSFDDWYFDCLRFKQFTFTPMSSDGTAISHPTIFYTNNMFSVGNSGRIAKAIKEALVPIEEDQAVELMKTIDEVFQELTAGSV